MVDLAKCKSRPSCSDWTIIEYSCQANWSIKFKTMIFLYSFMFKKYPNIQIIRLFCGSVFPRWKFFHSSGYFLVSNHFLSTVFCITCAHKESDCFCGSVILWKRFCYTSGNFLALTISIITKRQSDFKLYMEFWGITALYSFPTSRLELTQVANVSSGIINSI